MSIRENVKTWEKVVCSKRYSEFGLIIKNVSLDKILFRFPSLWINLGSQDSVIRKANISDYQTSISARLIWLKKKIAFSKLDKEKKLQASEPLIEHYVYQNFVLWAMTIDVYIHLSPWIRLCAFTAFHYG